MSAVWGSLLQPAAGAGRLGRRTACHPPSAGSFVCYPVATTSPTPLNDAHLGDFLWLKEERVVDANPSRGAQTYGKLALYRRDPLDRLEQRGLQVSNEARALHYLRRIGYNRLSPYVIPFKVGRTDRIKTGTAFDDVLSLYVFDRELRLLVLDALERGEVSVRSSLTDHMSLAAGGPFWYEAVGGFNNQRRHQRFLETVDDMCETGLRRSPNVPAGRWFTSRPLSTTSSPTARLRDLRRGSSWKSRRSASWRI